MNSIIETNPASSLSSPWRGTIGVLIVAIAMTLVYDFGWRVGIPLSVRNISGLTLFSCIMGGGALAYLFARTAGALPLAAVKIAMLIPVIWHVKEMLMAARIFGFGQGLYAGIQGTYLMYYGFVLMLMGLVHFFYELIQKVRKRGGKPFGRNTFYFFIPMVVVSGIEMIGLVFFKMDILIFQGFLAGYRALFM